MAFLLMKSCTLMKCQFTAIYVLHIFYHAAHSISVKYACFASIDARHFDLALYLLAIPLFSQECLRERTFPTQVLPVNKYSGLTAIHPLLDALFKVISELYLILCHDVLLTRLTHWVEYWGRRTGSRSPLGYSD